MLVKFTNKLWIDSENVGAVEINSDNSKITFNLKTGKEIVIEKLTEPDYQNIVNYLQLAESITKFI
jgi:catabolite regulation protein CreA